MTLIYEDNQGAIAITKNPVHHGRTKHIDVKHHAIRELSENGIINVEHINTNNMLADLLTKPLCVSKIQFLTQGMGMSLDE